MRTCLAAAVLACSVPAAPSARAAPQATVAAPLAEASAEYEQGAAAHQRGDYGAAMHHFARADEIVPDPSALEAALAAALVADEPVFAMALADRAGRAGSPPTLTAIADAVRKKFGARAGRIEVRCVTCSATLDGVRAAVGRPHWVEPGKHVVTIAMAAANERRTVRVDGGALVTLVPLPGKPEPVAPGESVEPVEPEGLSPIFFGVGLGLTATIGGVTIASGVDTAFKHDAFAADPSEDAAAAGEAAQIRTNVLLAVTGAFAITTLAFGFATDW